MPDRSLRLLTLLPQSPQGGERDAVLLRERPQSPPEAPENENTGKPDDASKPDNPFAPPAEGTPDSPWQPRRPAGGAPEGGRPPWGGQWSDQQPGRSPGGFGDRSGGGNNPEGGGTDPGKRWDPTDPGQRRARYALLCGMWAFFFALFGWPYVALLLGALALNWGISALRTKPRTPDPDTPATPETTGRPQRTAAITGLVTASLALALVAATFTAQLAYSDYYTCTNDALTQQSKQACNDLLPKQLKGILGGNA
ncbi:hypothetical protein SAMN04487983_101523 [Streptomyces sp. yr375]|uniref:hypothetical protein n=1 Tax=Streptomyces sp. yr375 TaxID=1761906 RepID=UPI0008B5B1DC|nr:hypothetical protein [Streptomyces sp. yr375]SER35575.1 hypothetical protein SAMN04487983_101523 [Streptomyces sp. yr375]